jgi:prefoldin subunit 5
LSLTNDVYYDVKHMVEEGTSDLRHRVEVLASRLRDAQEEIGYLRDRVRALEAEADGDNPPEEAEAAG